jgi:hypothetical protein
MGVRFPFVSSIVGQGAPPASGAETVVLLTPPLILPFDSAAVLIQWSTVMTIGVGSTAYQVKVRRGNTAAGTLLNGGNNESATAGNVVRFSGLWVDTNPGASLPQYVVTITGVSTTGAWAQFDAAIAAFAL